MDHSNEKGTVLYLLPYLLLILGIVFSVYHRTLSIGFLLDDFYHMDYLINAFDGDNSELFKVLFGSWSGPTGLNSFRPLTSFGLMVDYIVWHSNAFGYHLSNLLMYALTGIAIFLLTNQLVFDKGRIRYLTALVAALLFIVYPIHPESVAWIIGRVDTQCVLFFLFSIILYFKFRKSDNRLYLLGSFVLFLASLTTKEMAVVLPAVIAMSEFLLFEDLEWKKKKLLTRLMLPISYFIFLGVFALVRTQAIGTLVGGYGESDLKGTLLSFRNFLDLSTIQKIIFGVNEENPLSTDLSFWAQIAFLVTLAPLAFSMFSKRLLRLSVFLILWILVSLLPTFQIWHIYPNLVGSRLFFLGSGPLCILLGVAATLPFSEFAKPFDRIAVALRSMAILSATSLVCLWTIAVSSNIDVWIRAGQDIRSIQKHIKDLTAKSPGSGKGLIYLIDLPQDDSGAGLIGRPEYLRTMLSQPIAGDDYNEKVLTSERILSRNREFIYPELVKEISLNGINAGKDAEVSYLFLWNPKKRAYESWLPPEGSIPSTVEPIRLSSSNSKAVQIKTGELIWFESLRLDPFSVGFLKLSLPGVSDLTNLRARLVYRSSNQPASWIDYSVGPDGIAIDKSQFLFVPHWYRSWLLNGSIVDIGVQFTYVKEPISVKEPQLYCGLARQMFPLLSLRDSSQRKEISRQILMPCDSIAPIEALFDVSAVNGAKGAVVMVGKAETPLTISPADKRPDAALLLFEKKVDSLKGFVAIPESAIANSLGRHAVVVMAVDDKGQELGYISEPRLFEICADRPPEIK